MSNASTAPRIRDLSTPRSRHARDGYRSRSWHSDCSRPTFRSRHDVRSRHDRSRSDAPSPPARSRHDKRAQRCDDQSRSDDRSVVMAPVPWPDAVTETGRWAFPLPLGVFQKKVLSLLVDIRHRLKETQPASSAVHIERTDTMEDSDAQAFDTLVLQISRIGGRNTKDCVHKVLDRAREKETPFRGSKVYIAIQDGIMKFDSTATEDCIKVNVSEHLKHAPQRLGGGGFTTP
ncbi:hypothetical protein G5714_004600 [Onychostoma macrolepis]|uniref:Uncharacterized protein n=1 Tax=Onychostoma macrolepis TaxID=369639 RepID=A0A7J6D566_9TELE|nr:hypothetical protein G5714_004600 [Onychostoma macrolepis]